MNRTPEKIYLIDDGSGESKCWCDEPAPNEDYDPADAVEYRKVSSESSAVNELAHCFIDLIDALKDSSTNYADDHWHDLFDNVDKDRLQKIRNIVQRLTKK